MTIKSGRTVFISGAGSPTGIGFAAAKAFGALGYKVGITSTTDRIFNRVNELEALNIEAFGIVADLTVPQVVEKVVTDFLTRFSAIDVLVNNAGMACISTIQMVKMAQLKITHSMVGIKHLQEMLIQQCC